MQKVYRLRNGQFGYQGNVLNVGQKVADVVERLPRTVANAGIVAVWKPNDGQDTANGYKDFTVRRDALLR